MHTLFLYLKPFIRLIRREKLHRVALVLLFLILLGSTAFSYFEKKYEVSRLFLVEGGHNNHGWLW